MIVVSLLIVTLLFAIGACSTVVRAGRHRGRAQALLLAQGLAIGACDYLYGTWLFLSVYLRVVLAVLLAALAIRALVKSRSAVARPLPVVALRMLATVVALALIVLYYAGTEGSAKTLNLHAPFRHGRYLVFQGGKGLPTNAPHVAARGAIFAIDFVKLNAFGNRAHSVFSKDLNAYEIYGDTVYAPCDGVVEDTRDDNPDNIPPSRRRGPHNLNKVLINTGNAYIFLGHFRQGGVLVHTGDRLRAGDPIGLAGNSGSSLEPHLHIQAHERTGTGLPWYSEQPLLMTFDGKEYLLNEVMEVR